MRRPLLALIAVLVVLLAVNTVVMNRDTEPAKADAGRVIDIGQSNRNRWLLVPGDAWKPGCVTPPFETDTDPAR